MKFDWAPSAYRALNGIFCVYKPTDITISHLIRAIKTNLIKDLNALPCYKYERQQRRVVAMETSSSSSGEDSAQLPIPLDVPANMVDLSEHRLVLGPRYIKDDLTIRWLHGLALNSSGVLVLAVGPRGCGMLRALEMARLLSVYHVKARLGIATDTFLPDGRVIQRTSYSHVKRSRVDKLCSAIESNHSKNVFAYAEVDIQSDAAYELASKGLVRPVTGDTPPILYSVKCIDFSPPAFTLEIHSINEECDDLCQTVNDLGVAVKSTAVCAALHRLRFGHFTLEHALLRKHWSLEHIVQNIQACRKNVTLSKLLQGENLNHAIATKEEEEIVSIE